MIEQKILAVKIKEKGELEYLRRPQVKQYENKATVIWAWFTEVELGESITVKLHYRNADGETLIDEQFFIPYVTTEDLINDIPDTPNFGQVVIPSGTKVYTYEIPQGLTAINGQLEYNIVAYLDDDSIVLSQNDKIKIWPATPPSGTFIPDVIDPTLESLLASKTDLVDFNALRNGTLGFTLIDLDGHSIDWNDLAGTVQIELLNGVVLDTGLEVLKYGRASGSITDGTPAQFVKYLGQRPIFKTPVASEVNDNPHTVRVVATQSFTNNQDGYLARFGNVRDINTSIYLLPGEDANDETTWGDTRLWFDPTTNGLTRTRPTSPNAKISMGYVTKFHNTQGIIDVDVVVYPKFTELQDVQNGATNGQVWVYDATLGVTKPSSRLTVLEQDVANITADYIHNTSDSKPSQFKIKNVDESAVLESGANTLEGRASDFIQFSVDGYKSTIDIAKTYLFLRAINNSNSISLEDGYYKVQTSEGDYIQMAGAVMYLYSPDEIDISSTNVALNGSIYVNGVTLSSILGAKADLGLDGKVLTSQLPSYVDDVLEVATFSALPVTGEASKIYVVLDTNKSYRWSGSTYVLVASDLVLGETSSSAYRGDRGKTAYDHSQVVNANPHNVSFSQLANKPTTIGGFGITDAYDKTYIDNLTDYNGWQQTLLTLTPLSNTDTISRGDLVSKDRVMFVCKNTATGEFDTDELVGDLIVDGTKFVFFDNANVNLTVTSTVCTFNDSVGDYELIIYGLNVTPQVAENIGFDGTGTNYLASETELQGAVSELDSKVKEVDTNAKERDIIFEQRLDSIEEATRKQSSDVASASDTEIISLGKDVAETPLRVQVDGLLLDAEQLVTNGDFSDGTTGFGTDAASISVVSDNLLVQANGTQVYGAINYPISTPLVVGNKYYLVQKSKVDSSVCASIQTYVNDGSGARQITIIVNPTYNTWYFNSGIITAQSNVSHVFVTLHVYADATTANGKVMTVDYVYEFNLSTLISNKQYSPLYATTFDLMSDAQIQAQMDLWVQDGTLPNDIQPVNFDKRVKSVGKNLFDKSKYATSYAYKIKVKPSTIYTWSTSSLYKTYDKDMVEVQSGTATSVTTSANVFYIAFSGITTPSTFQLELGSTATAYTPYRSSELYLNGNSKGYKLPNGVMDTIEMRNGKAYRVQRINKVAVVGVVAVNTTNYPLAKNGGQFINYLTSGGSEIGVIGTNSTSGSGNLYYELATPIETEISAIGNAMAYPNGTVYVEQATSDFGIYGTNLTISNSNYPILAFDEIYKLNADGSSTKLANSGATISGDKLSFTHSSLTNGDSVWFSYYYYSSTPNIMGRTTVYFYDDKLIVTDSVTSTVYRLVPTVASGVLTWTIVAI